MMKGPIEPQLMFAIKTLSAENQQKRRNPQVDRQTPPLSSSNLVYFLCAFNILTFYIQPKILSGPKLFTIDPYSQHDTNHDV
jgi:hypothetical protein